MFNILKQNRNGQAAHKKSVLLNSALIKLNNVLSGDARANAIAESNDMKNITANIFKEIPDKYITLFVDSLGRLVACNQ